MSLVIHCRRPLGWAPPSGATPGPRRRPHRTFFPALGPGACRLLLSLVLVGAGSLCQAQDDSLPLGMEPEEIMSNALAVASEMLQPGGLAVTNAPGTNVHSQRPGGELRSRGESRRDNRPPSNDRERTDRDSRRRSYREPYDSARIRGALPGGDHSATNAPARSNAAPVRLDYAAFSIVADRNIFDPNRSPRRGPSGPTVKPKQIDSFALVGTMSYEKGNFAFFDGNSSAFRKALKLSDSIGGCKITEIGANNVQLTAGTNRFELRVGAQLRREDEGEWHVSSQPMDYAAALTKSSGSSSSGSGSTSTSTTSSAATSGGDNDVLKRMMQRREQE